ncbi:thioesterase family protein [Nonomuraea terrae]|uniref:Thioesterase family protein n=2 Tax=Nonomuraea terrae TaxID=2530383 RepID=A0A4R4Y8H7_9ACTN|nr:thioesterase family protein [Nonomuraea terrae]
MGTFHEATAVTRRGHAYETALDPQWTVAGKPHGGYLLATMTRAACHSAGPRHPQPATVTAAFLTAPTPGPADIHIDHLRTGHGTTQTRARLTQNDTLHVEALITLEHLTHDGPTWSGLEPVHLPAEHRCPRTPPREPGGTTPVPLMEVIEQRLDPLSDTPSHRGFIAGWQRLADGTDWDPLSLLVALDLVPSVTYDLGLPDRTTTIQFSAYIRRIPAPGPLRFSMHASDITNARMDETTYLWDSEDRLVAQATQLAAIRTPT